MREADTAIATGMHIVDNLPAGCTNNWDLQTVMTHEWGHAFGLAHETAGFDEVMYPSEQACRLRRHLGNGDYHGLASLY